MMWASRRVRPRTQSSGRTHLFVRGPRPHQEVETVSFKYIATTAIISLITVVAYDSYKAKKR